jgi:hypothetical protein
MAAPQRVVEQFNSPASRPGPANSAPDPVALAVEGNANTVAITPPWHIRHARMLIAAVAALVTAGFAYLSYHVWRIQNDPVDRILATRGQPAALPLPDSLTAAPPIAPTPPRVVISAPAVAAAPSRPQPRASPASSASSASSSATRPTVTHTQREGAGDARVKPAAASAVVVQARPSSQASPPCSEGVAALGLCVPVTTAGQ